MGRDRIRAGILAVIYALFFVLATPGLDGSPRNFLKTEEQEQKLAESIPSAAVSVLKVFADFNREVRRPVVKWLTPIQRPLRIEQTWRLYGDGPRLVHRMEIRVDEEVVYRSGDPDLDWERGTWRFRRVRPMPATLADHCRKRDQPVNRIGFSRLVTQRALEDFPEAERVEVRILSGRFPDPELKPTHGLVREAPDWELVDVHYGEGPCR
jgi:hypothetical protein